MLDIDLPWTKMRQVYRLLGLVRRYGPERVEAWLPQGTRARCRRRLAHRPHARAGRGRVLGRDRRSSGRPGDPDAVHQSGGGVPARRPGSGRRDAMTDTISVDLKRTLKRLKLSPMLDTLPERLVLARQRKTP